MGLNSKESAIVYGSVKLMEPGKHTPEEGLVILINSPLARTANRFETPMEGIADPEPGLIYPEPAKFFPMEMTHT